MDEKQTVRPLPYPIDQYQTHFEGCWRLRRHHNCAVLEVERLREKLRRETVGQIIDETHATSTTEVDP